MRLRIKTTFTLLLTVAAVSAGTTVAQNPAPGATASGAGFWATVLPAETAATVNNRVKVVLILSRSGVSYCSTVSCTVVECVSVPLAPVIVSV